MSVEQARARLQWYFGDRGGVSGSSAEIFAGKGRGQKADPRAYRRRPRYFDGQAVPAEATQIHATETRKQGVSRLPIASGSSGGHILRAIRSLPALEQQWVHYCYNPSQKRKQEALKRLGPGLWEEFKSRVSLAGEHQRTLVILSAMLRLQLDQARSFPALCRWRNRIPVELEEAIAGSEWDEKYSEYWSGIHDTIISLDNSAMFKLDTSPKQR